jgi:hypothetical protein
MSTPRIAAALIACLILGGPVVDAGAQPEEPAAEPNIDEQVAAALLSRGEALQQQGDAANAKKLFIESLERSPEGPAAPAALARLRSVNEELGIADRDHGRPGAPAAPIDPYGGGGETPLDPYGGGGATPLDPYGGQPPDQPESDEPNTETSRGLMTWGGGYGLTLGLAIGGPVDPDTDDLRPAAVLLGLGGAAAGIAGGYFASRRYPLSAGQVSAIASFGNWGAINLGFLGDPFTGDDTDANEIFKFIAAGGLLGAGGGLYYAKRAEPSEGEVAVVNSLSLYGTAGGLLLGVAMSPPRPEAYSINAVVGSTLGIGTGLWLAPRLEMSRRRTLWIDAGAATGVAASWALFYPLIADEGTNNDEQVTGFVSTLALFGGAGLAYYLTRDMDEPSVLETEDPVAARYPSPPGLIQRSASGSWSLGAPVLRPMAEPGSGEGLSMGLDLAAGRW